MPKIGRGWGEWEVQASILAFRLPFFFYFVGNLLKTSRPNISKCKFSKPKQTSMVYFAILCSHVKFCRCFGILGYSNYEHSLLSWKKPSTPNKKFWNLSTAVKWAKMCVSSQNTTYNYGLCASIALRRSTVFEALCWLILARLPSSTSFSEKFLRQILH